MIDPFLTDSAALTSPSVASSRRAAVLVMKPHERMAGSVPVWEKAKAEDSSFAAALRAVDEPGTTALTYDETAPRGANEPQEFTFGDLIDMVNPLQHIPLVSGLYRYISGDEIRPIGRLIGGAVYGGGVGAVASLANIAVEHETGKDIVGNVMTMAMTGETPTYRTQSQDPAARLGDALAQSDMTTPGALPDMATGFAPTEKAAMPKAQVYAHNNAARYND